VDVTGASPEQARQFLHGSNGDVALAISSFFEAQAAEGSNGDGSPIESDLGNVPPMAVPEPSTGQARSWPR
jgi:UBA-like domain